MTAVVWYPQSNVKASACCSCSSVSGLALSTRLASSGAAASFCGRSPQFRRGLPRLPRSNFDAVHSQRGLSCGWGKVRSRFACSTPFALSPARCVQIVPSWPAQLSCHRVPCPLARQGRSTGPAVCIQGQTVSVSLPNLISTMPSQSVPTLSASLDGLGGPSRLAVSVCVHL